MPELNLDTLPRLVIIHRSKMGTGEGSIPPDNETGGFVTTLQFSGSGREPMQ